MANSPAASDHVLARLAAPANTSQAWHSTVPGPQTASRPALALVASKARALQLVPRGTAMPTVAAASAAFARLSLCGGQSTFSTESTPAAPPTKPYASLSVGAPRETYPGECRVALAPANVALLLKKGFGKVLVEKGAGAQANFADGEYAAAGATLVDDAAALWSQADIVLKVRGPSPAEADSAREGQTIISFLRPSENKELVNKLAARKATVFAMDMVPRISRAQGFDALSSMANVAGYKAVVVAADMFPRILAGQATAAGKIPPGKVLVIGAGVAGLSAISTARRMGALVRGFDTRSAAREQVESFGAEFIEVELREEGAGGGGYAKVMSEAFHQAELKLFSQQAPEMDIIITTALIPGVAPPKLITKAMVETMKPGSVIVDLAAEAGGNCELTQPGKLITHKGVQIIGMSCIPPTCMSHLI